MEKGILLQDFMTGKGLRGLIGLLHPFKSTIIFNYQQEIDVEAR